MSADVRVVKGEFAGMNLEAAIPSRGYLICCIERTGSNLLAGALTQTGRAGRPHEYFNPVLQNVPWMRAILGDSTPLTGVTKILRAGATPNGLFGTKLHWGHLRHLARALDSGGQELPTVEPGAALKFLSQFPQMLPTAEFLDLLRARVVSRSNMTAAYAWFESYLPDLRIVWLRRRNMVARAISHYRALHTKEWHRFQAAADGAVTAEPALQPAMAPDFDLARIHQLYGLGLFQEESWQWLFQERGIVPHYVTYEDLDADYEPTVRGVLEFLGVGAAGGTIAPTNLARQADALSQEWETRYRKLSEEAGL